MNFSADIFISAIMLLIQIKDEDTERIINELLTSYQEESKYNTLLNTDLNKRFIDLLTRLKAIPDSEEGKIEKSSIVVSFLSDPIIQNDPIFTEAISSISEALKNNEYELKNKDQLQRRIKSSLTYNTFNKSVTKMFSRLRNYNDTVDEEKQEQYFKEVVELAKKLVNTTTDIQNKKSKTINRIKFSDRKSIQESLSMYKDRTIKGILKTGLQGFNQMCGKRGGLVLGESVCINALSHNFKSGLLMTIARGLVVHNIPTCEPGKKPLILFISLENEAYKDMMWLFKTAYEHTFNTSSEGLTDNEIIDFIYEFYNKQGYEFIIEKKLGSEFGYEEFVAMIEAYKAEGYDINAILLDYANEMTKGKIQEANHLAVKYLLKKMCDYTKDEAILFVTAHQLNREADKIASSGKPNVVKYFGAEHLGESKGSEQVFDLTIYIHLETNYDGDKYLTIKRGKHRYVDDTPEAHKYYAYKFTEYGIPDDINGKPQFTRDIYADHKKNKKKEDDFLSNVF